MPVMLLGAVTQALMSASAGYCGAVSGQSAGRRRGRAHEHDRIPDDATELIDVAVEIPMIGTGASLNVAVAGSLVLYQLAGFL